jgi:5'(3')-deoxyribonucleotidase
MKNTCHFIDIRSNKNDELKQVLADTMNTWIKHYNKIYRNSLTIQDIKKWEFWKDLGMPKNKVDEIYGKVWTDVKNLPLIEEDAATTINGIKTIVELDIVTAVLSDVKAWLYSRGIVYHKIEYTDKKSNLDYNIFIDDNPHLTNEISEEKICLLYDQPWNRKDIKENKNIIRIKSLKEAADYIKTIV